MEAEGIALTVPAITSDGLAARSCRERRGTSLGLALVLPGGLAARSLTGARRTIHGGAGRGG
jgi:hypothetical protein